MLLLYTTALSGPGATADSVAYLSSAQSVLEGHGYVAYDGSRFLWWPPLFPTSIAAVKFLFHVDIVRAAFSLNVGAHAGAVWLISRALVRRLGNPWLAPLGTALVLAGLPLLRTASYIWSEPLFNFGIAGTLAMLLEEPETERGRWIQAGQLSLFALIAVLTRYPGVVLLVPISMWILARTGHRWWRKLARITVVSTPAVALLGLWMLRTYRISHTLTGPRAPSTIPWRDNLKQLCLAVEAWFGIHSGPESALGYTRWLIALGALGMIFAWFNRTWARRVLPSVMVAVGYAAFLVYSNSTVLSDPIELRLASPLYIPLIFVLILTVDAVITMLPKRVAWALASIPLFALVVVWRPTRVQVRRDRTEGVGGFSQKRFAPVAERMKELPGTSLYFSNSVDAFYYMTAGTRSLWLPSPANVNVAQWVAGFPADRPVYVIWFDGGWAGMATPDDIGKQADVQLVIDGGFAKVFKVAPR